MELNQTRLRRIGQLKNKTFSPPPPVGLLQAEISGRLFKGGHGGLRDANQMDETPSNHLSALTHCLQEGKKKLLTVLIVWQIHE